MSRHLIQHDKYDVAVGWDRALDTFYVIVDEETQEDQNPIILLGAKVGDFQCLDSFITIFTTRLSEANIQGASVDSSLQEKLK